MNGSKTILMLAGVGAFAATATLLQADTTPATIEVVGTCQRTLAVDKQKVEVESIDLDKLFAAGLATAQRALSKTAELMETSPKKEVSANVNVSVRDKDSGEPDKDISVPLKFSIPKLTAADMDSFAEYVAGDTSEYDNLIKTRTSLGVSEAEFEKQYKACMKDALADAKTKAQAEAAKRGVKLGDMVSAKTAADVSAASEASREADMRLKVNVSFRTI